MRALAACVTLLAACGSPPPEPTVAPPSSIVVPPASIAPPTSVAPPTTVASAGVFLGGVDPEAARACTSDDQCVLITNPCGALLSANRTQAAALQHEYVELSRVTECQRLADPGPQDPACIDGSCTTRPAEFAEARACRHDRECYAVALTCRWAVASHTAPTGTALDTAIAEAAAHPEPCTLAPAPAVRCAYGFCSAASALLP